MMTIGIDLATGPDCGVLSVRAPDGWYIIDPGAEAFEFRTAAHESRVEAALQDRLRTHADHQGPCVTAEDAASPLTCMRAYLRGAINRFERGMVFDEWSRWDGSGWEQISWEERRLPPPLPSQRMASAMGLGPRKYLGPCSLAPNLRGVVVGRSGWMLENPTP